MKAYDGVTEELLFSFQAYFLLKLRSRLAEIVACAASNAPQCWRSPYSLPPSGSTWLAFFISHKRPHLLISNSTNQHAFIHIALTLGILLCNQSISIRIISTRYLEPREGNGSMRIMEIFDPLRKVRVNLRERFLKDPLDDRAIDISNRAGWSSSNRALKWNAREDDGLIHETRNRI